MKVYEAITQAIQQEGAEIIFGVMGDANQNMLARLADQLGVRFIPARHEQSAVSMADGYARASGKPGLASVTQGPGLTNTATSLVAANRHGSPLLLLAGDVSLRDPSNVQKIDQLAFSLLTAGAGAVVEHPRGVDYALDKAFRSLRGGWGPFVLNVPQDVQNAEMLDPHWSYHPGYQPIERILPPHAGLAQAALWLRAAKRPALLVGLGAVRSGAEDAIRTLAEQLDAPVATTLPAKGTCASYPLYLSVCGGLGKGLAMDALQQCDLLLVVGASLNQWTTHFGSVVEQKRLIQIDVKQQAFGRYVHADLALQGDAKATLEALSERLDTEKRVSDQSLAPFIRSWQPTLPVYHDGEGTIDPRRAAWHLEKRLPEDRIIVEDGGHAAFVFQQILEVNSPYHWFPSLDFGAIGQGLSLAIGVCFANPGKRVTHPTADSSFMMNLADFETAVRYHLPLSVFVFNDQSVGQERHDLAHKGLPVYYADVPSPDFARLAQGFGVKGYRVESPDQLHIIDHALEEADGPFIVDVRINGDVELPISWEIAQHLS